MGLTLFSARVVVRAFARAIVREKNAKVNAKVTVRESQSRKQPAPLAEMLLSRLASAEIYSISYQQDAPRIPREHLQKKEAFERAFALINLINFN